MRSLPLLLALGSALACGPDSPSTDGSGSGSATVDPSSDEDATADPGTADGTGPTAPPSTTTTTTSPGTDDPTSTTEECTSVCVADHPCFGWEPRCVDPFTIEIWRELSCEEVCVGACDCIGASCTFDHDEPCPEGTLCLESQVDSLSVASCAPVDTLCGGPQGLSCDGGRLCEYDEGLCPACLTDPAGCGVDSPVGLCVDLPPFDLRCPTVDDEGDPLPPQCGCDGVTYDSECARRQAGVALAGAGPCPP